MFEKMKGMMNQLQTAQKLMQDENFKAFIAHPKVQELFKDPEFKIVAKTQDFAKILAHSKFAQLLRDPEIAALMAKVNFKEFMA